MSVEARPKPGGQERTVTLTLSEGWKQTLAALAQDIRRRINTLELAIITELRQNGQNPFQETPLSSDPRLKESLELLAFCEVDDALRRGMRASISPRRKPDENYPEPHIIIKTYISRTCVEWGLVCLTLEGLGEYGSQIIEALENRQFVILEPPTPPPG